MGSELKEESRDIFYDYPVLEFIGWLVVAYFALFFVTVYVGPALFGTRPYGAWYRRRRRSISANEQADDVGLISAVSNSLENIFYN